LAFLQAIGRGVDPPLFKTNPNDPAVLQWRLNRRPRAERPCVQLVEECTDCVFENGSAQLRIKFYGRGNGVGCGLDVGGILGVGVGRGVAVGLDVAVAVGVGLAVGVAVGVGEGGIGELIQCITSLFT
jgi:hypothetical protein